MKHGLTREAAESGRSRRRSQAAGGRSISRVRAVLVWELRYFLVQHNSRRLENVGRWGFPGGRLKTAEEPKSALRRELMEELHLRVPYLVELGDWRACGETQRIFACKLEEPIGFFDADEILDVAWLSYSEVVRLAETGQTQYGFELPAIETLRRRFPTVGAESISLSHGGAPLRART